MAICLELDLVADRYDAADGLDPRRAEWPPHPARVVSALRSSAIGDADLTALRALEELPPPRIHASDVLSSSRSRSYVVTNTLSAAGGNLAHLGRTSGLRERVSVFPIDPHVQLVWVDESLSDDDVGRLDSIAARVPYLGRSTSLVFMGVTRVEEIIVPPGLEIYEPVDEGREDLRLRVPYPGYVAELDALFDQGFSSWQASDGSRASQPYRQLLEDQDPDHSQAEYHSPYRDLVALRFRDHRPAGSLAPTFAAALRSLVMSQTKDPLPPALHGHGYPGHPHVAYLGLPVCGHAHADGHLVALAVAIPGMDEADRRRILRGILGPDGDGRVSLRVPGFREPFDLEYRPDDPVPRAGTAAFWSRPSRQVVTATPIVLDRYPKNGDLAAGVVQSLVLAGLPEPAWVEVSRSPMTTGAVSLTPRELPRRAQGRIYCHARVRFDQPVIGPVLAGAGRYFGVGLFQPEREDGGHDASR